jgi:hypothetical protein
VIKRYSWLVLWITYSHGTEYVWTSYIQMAGW